MNKADQIKLELRTANYWEHFKYEADLARFLPPEHPKRQELVAEYNRLRELIAVLNPV